MSASIAPQEPHALERERDYYRAQVDEYGAQVARLQRELATQRRQARRSRTTALVVRDVYRLGDERVPLDEVRERLVMVLLDRLRCDSAAILEYRQEQSAFAVQCTRGIAADASVTVTGDVETCSVDSESARAGQLAEGSFEQRVAQAVDTGTGLGRWLWASLSAPRIALLVGGASGRGAAAFDAGDRDTAESALAAFAGLVQRQRDDAALRASEAHYRALFESVNDAIAVAQAGDGRLISANRMMSALFGYQPDELPRISLPDLFADDSSSPRELVEAYISRARHGEPQVFSALGARHDGSTFHAELNIGTVEGEDGRHLVLVVRDISERIEAEQRLRHSALHDSLTGLPNRALVLERLQQAQRRHHRDSNYLSALLFLDINRFKVLNDSLGHHAGDELLVSFGQRLRTIMRPADTVARLGGDEFVVLLEGVSGPEAALTAARRIADSLKQPFSVAGQDVTANASIGIALSSETGHDPDHLLRDADLAMYKAKASRSEHVAVFDPRMHEQAMSQLVLERDLRHALEHDELTLAWQPVVSLHEGRLRGFEGLVRWQHPHEGLVMPGAFVPAAEENGLIVPLGAAVLECAFRQLRAWERRFGDADGALDLRLSVNLSARQLQRAGLADEILEAVHRAGCAPEHLAMEMTETAIMDNADVAMSTLARLRELGMKIYMDDFGTGYSSLSYLHRFPIDVIKIDRSFVIELDNGHDGEQVIDTIVALGHNLGKQVIAEGIETRSQADTLARLGCDFGQGYYYSQPLLKEAAADCIALERGS